MKKIPDNMTIWVRINSSGETFFIASKSDRSQYVLYQKTNNGFEKIGTATNPILLERKYIFNEE